MIGLDTVRRIAELQGDGIPVVSLYVTVPPNGEQRDSVHARTQDLLAEARPVAEDRALSHEARISVREDLGRIRAESLRGDWHPPGVAVFACHARDLFEVIQLPRSTRERIIVDEDPWTRPLFAMLDEEHPTCIVIIDRKSAQLWELRQGELVERRHVPDQSLRMPNYPGWHGLNEHNVAHRAQELAKRHYLHVGRVLEQLVDTDGLELVAVGGHHDDVPQFLQYLPRGVRSRVAGTFSIDAANATRGDIKKQAQDIVDRYERVDEQRRVAAVLERAASGQPAAVGVQECLWAASLSAVQELVVQEDVVLPGVVCPSCGWLAEAGTTCPLDGTELRATPDVLDELVETVLDDSGAVEHVHAETPIKQHLVAAALRFPLPPAPVS